MSMRWYSLAEGRATQRLEGEARALGVDGVVEDAPDVEVAPERRVEAHLDAVHGLVGGDGSHLDERRRRIRRRLRRRRGRRWRRRRVRCVRQPGRRGQRWRRRGGRQRRRLRG
eukprot:scaffold50494_cov64-Phaeocystis_antarctica.AAC.4